MSRLPPSSLARVRALENAGLMDGQPDPALDRLTELVRVVLGVPVSLISLLDDDRQVFKSEQGLPEPWCSLGESPLSHSFCQHVVEQEAPLLVTDARLDPLVRDNLAIEDLSVVAYLGVPLATPDGVVIGSLCAIDSKPRTWTERDYSAMQALAGPVMAEIAVRHLLRERDATAAELRTASNALRELNHGLEARVAERTEEVRALAKALTMAEQEERRRIGHVLHDDLQQVLHGVQMQLAVGDHDRAAELVKQASQLTRSLAHELTPPILRDGTLGELVDWLATRTNEIHGLAVETDVAEGVPRVEEPVRVLLYGVVREFLFNVVKHASAHRVLVTVEVVEGPSVQLVVADDGVGFDPSATARRPTGLGLAAATDRIELAGGHLRIVSAPGAGTRVVIEVPATPAPSEERAGS